MLSISSLLNPVAHPAMSHEQLPGADRPTLPSVRELFPDLPRSAFATTDSAPRVGPLPVHLEQGLHPHQPRLQHPQHARRPSNPTNVPMPIPQYLTSPRPRPDSRLSSSPASASPATPSPSASSASSNASSNSGALYQVLALGPNGLNAVQTETEKPIGIYRQDKRRHEVMDLSSSDSETRRYVCQDCGTAFLRPSELRTHQHRHTGRKAYVCTRCGKDFATSSNLARHIRTLHPGDTLAERRRGSHSGRSSAASSPPLSEASDA